MQMLLSPSMKLQGRNQGGLLSACSIIMFIVAVAVWMISFLLTGLSYIQKQSIFVNCKFYCQKDPPAKASDPGSFSCFNSILSEERQFI